MGFPMGLGITNSDGNGNGKEWETTWMETGMRHFPCDLIPIDCCNMNVYYKALVSGYEAETTFWKRLTFILWFVLLLHCIHLYAVQCSTVHADSAVPSISQTFLLISGFPVRNRKEWVWASWEFCGNMLLYWEWGWKGIGTDCSGMGRTGIVKNHSLSYLL